MPPAKLPARIDRSGLGGGSFFSPPDGVEPSPLATGAVAAATEAMLIGFFDLSGATPVFCDSWRPADRSIVLARQSCTARSSSFECRSWGSGSRSPNAMRLGRRDQLGHARSGGGREGRTSDDGRASWSVPSVGRHTGAVWEKVDGAHACVALRPEKKRQ